MRYVLGQELVESLSSGSPPGLVPDVQDTLPYATSSSIHRPPIPAPKSDTARPQSDQSQEKGDTAKYPSRRPTNLYIDDGYEPTTREGLKKLNDDILLAVRKLAQHSFEVYVQRFCPKRWAKMRDNNGRQDRAAKLVDRKQVTGGSTATTSAGE
jgi:hypothetical protein